MILTRYPTLGALPEILVTLVLGGLALFAGMVFFRVSHRPPVVLVPNAQILGEASPAIPDEAYAKAISDHFLKHWNVWNEYTFKPRRKIATSLMWPGVQARYLAQAEQQAPLVSSFGQASSIVIDNIEPKIMSPGVWFMTVKGTIRVLYAGLDAGRAKSSPFTAILILRQIQPTSQNPMCLEVYGFKQVVDGEEDSPKEPK